jgi:hypothetical protein
MRLRDVTLRPGTESLSQSVKPKGYRRTVRRGLQSAKDTQL